jgi:uncharacterized lipoprotein YmbA
MKPYAWSYLPMLLCVAACSSGPPLRTYLLTPPLEPAGVAPALALRSGGIMIARVRVPDYLDTTDIWLREGRNEMKVSGTGRWGERLSHGLTRGLAADLGRRLPSDEVLADMSSTAHRQVLINVNALDLWPDGRCVMGATWAIVDNVAPRSVAYGGGTFNSSSITSVTQAGDARLVGAISQTLGKLADAIALNIRQSSERSAQRAD